METRILKFPRKDMRALRCAWVATGCPTQPLECVWIPTKETSAVQLTDVANEEAS